MIELYRKYVKNKIFNKMLLVYSIITITSISLLTAVFISYYVGNEIENELNIHSEVIFNIEKRFEEQDNISNSISNGINTQPKIIDEILKLTTSTYEEYLSYKLDSFSISNTKQLDLKYLLDTILSNRSDALAVVIDDKNKECKNEIVLNYDRWYDIKNNEKSKKYIRKISRPIKNVDTMYTIGYIDIYFDLNDIDKIIGKSNLKGNIIIVDENDDIIYDSNKILLESNIDKKIYIKNNNFQNQYEKDNILSEKYPVIRLKEDVQTGFKYTSIINENDLDANSIKSKILFIALICILIILFITYVVINSYSLKLRQMMKGIEKIKNGDLDTRFNIQSEDDELDMIAIRIDEMSKSLQYNINKNYIAEVKQKQAEINALQAQINPHFLYNTLEVIRMCALASKNKEVAQMIYNLASMFRYCTYNNGMLVTLKDEINHCKMYLDLCSTRYRGMLNYEIDIDESSLNYLLPKFTMQPILENCISHGLKKDCFENLIKVSILQNEDEIEIRIKDNGNGIKEEKLNTIRDELHKNLQKTSSIGLMNINNRLKLKFGDNYGISIDSEENKGTIVSIKIPILGDEDENV